MDRMRAMGRSMKGCMINESEDVRESRAGRRRRKRNIREAETVAASRI